MNLKERSGEIIAAPEKNSQSSSNFALDNNSSSVSHNGIIHFPRGATSIPIIDGHLALHGIPSRQSFTGRSDISSTDGESTSTLRGNSSSSSSSIRSNSSSLWDVQSDGSRAGSDIMSHSHPTGDSNNSIQVALGKDNESNSSSSNSSSSSSSSSSRSKKKYILDKKYDQHSIVDINQNKRPRGTDFDSRSSPSVSIDATSNSINVASLSDQHISRAKSPAHQGQIAIAVVLASIRVRANYCPIFHFIVMCSTIITLSKTCNLNLSVSDILNL